MEEAKEAFNDALKKADEMPKMTIPSLIDSMFEVAADSLKAQRAEFARRRKRNHGTNDNDSSDYQRA